MTKIPVKISKKLFFIDTEQLIAVKIEDYVCKCLFENNEQINFVISLRKLENKLPEFFIKISRNYLINTQKIKYIDLQKREVKTEHHTFKVSCRNLTKIRHIFIMNNETK